MSQNLRFWPVVEAEVKVLRGQVKRILLQVNDQRRDGEIAQVAVLDVGHISLRVHA